MMFSTKIKCLGFSGQAGSQLLICFYWIRRTQQGGFAKNLAEKEGIPDWVSAGGQQGGGWVPVQYGTGTGLVLTKYKHSCVQNLFLLGEKGKWTQENKIWVLKGKELC